MHIYFFMHIYFSQIRIWRRTKTTELSESWKVWQVLRKTRKQKTLKSFIGMVSLKYVCHITL